MARLQLHNTVLKRRGDWCIQYRSSNQAADAASRVRISSFCRTSLDDLLLALKNCSEKFLKWEFSCGEFRILSPLDYEGVGLAPHHVDLGDEQAVDVPANDFNRKSRDRSSLDIHIRCMFILVFLLTFPNR